MPIIRLGVPLIELSSVNSTNMYAISQVKEDKAISGSCYRADFQTNGKGQLGKHWHSQESENLLCTYVLNINSLKNNLALPINVSTKATFGLAMAIAIGVKDFFKSFALEDTKIKWPNDLYWRDRKAGGILIENLLRGTTWAWSIIGIGININQTTFEQGLQNPVSLKQITGNTFDIRLLQTALSTALTIRINEWLTGEFDNLLADYNNNLYKKGEVVSFKKGQIRFKGTVIGVEEQGALIVHNGMEQSYRFGEIKWEI